MVKAHFRLAALGLVSVSAAAGFVGGCAEKSASDKGGENSGDTSADVASLVAAIEQAKDGSKAFESQAGSCLGAFTACRSADGADATACREQLKACVPAAPAECGPGDHGGGGDGGHGGAPDDPGGDHGGAGGGPPDDPGGDHGGAGGGPPAYPGGDHGGVSPSPTLTAGGEACVPPGFGRGEAFLACHATLSSCVDALGEPPEDEAAGEAADEAPEEGATSCGRTFADCVHAALGKEVGDLCAKALEKCGDNCGAVRDACSEGGTASP